jgi:hypothetical protein
VVFTDSIRALSFVFASESDKVFMVVPQEICAEFWLTIIIVYFNAFYAVMSLGEKFKG